MIYDQADRLPSSSALRISAGLAVVEAAGIGLGRMASAGDWSRRQALVGVGAGLAAPAIAQTLGAGPATATEQSGPQDHPAGDSGAFLETAFDQALRMSVPVYLDGKGPFPFVVDTGANRSVVSTEVAALCRLPEAGTAPVHGIIAVEPARLVKVGRLRVGAVISSGLRLPAVAQSRLGAAGILGLDVLRNRQVLLGFRDQSFQVFPSSHGPDVGPGMNSRIAAAGQPVTVPARLRSGQLVIIDAEAASQPVTAFLDSGSQVTVANRALRDIVVATRADLAARIVHSELISATGQRAPAEFAPLPGLRLGGQQLGSPLVAFADLHIFDLWDLRDRPTLLIGVDVLRRFDQVGFDFGKRRITFWPPRSRRAPPTL
ncbi:aspartyl protease family protein [Phenylobacterium hankyongense]|nr:aspartyl protease family protein [Phenylobacterium hankyongense]